MEIPDGDITSFARLLRFNTIKAFYLTNKLSKEEAEELLRGPLSPGEENVDDSALLNAEEKVLMDAFFGEKIIKDDLQ